jgi:hypothetical protein
VTAPPLLIGTYRGSKHIHECIESVGQHLSGYGDITFIDDSPDPTNADRLKEFGKVVSVGGRGYQVAMQAACAEAAGRECFWLEEDFTFLQDIDLGELHDILYHRPYLAQVVLLRGPHFEIEHRHGGLIEALQFKGHTFTAVNGIIEHTACFSMNPTLIRGEVGSAGWPTGRWSEEIKGRHLVAQGYRFGYLPGIRVAHDGERTGHGY